MKITFDGGKMHRRSMDACAETTKVVVSYPDDTYVDEKWEVIETYCVSRFSKRKNVAKLRGLGVQRNRDMSANLKVVFL